MKPRIYGSAQKCSGKPDAKQLSRWQNRQKKNGKKAK